MWVRMKQKSVSYAMFLLWFGKCVFKTALFWVTKTYKETPGCVESFNHDNYVRQTVTQMGDTKFLAKLSGDMIASKAWYHE